MTSNTTSRRIRITALGVALALGVGLAGAQGASAATEPAAAPVPATRCEKAANLASELEERMTKLTGRRAEIAQKLADAETGGDADAAARLQRRLDRLDRVIARVDRLQDRVDTAVANHCSTGQ